MRWLDGSDTTPQRAATHLSMSSSSGEGFGSGWSTLILGNFFHMRRMAWKLESGTEPHHQHQKRKRVSKANRQPTR